MSQTEHERTNTVFIHGRSKCNMHGFFRTVHEVKTRQGKRCVVWRKTILSWHATIVAFQRCLEVCCTKIGHPGSLSRYRSDFGNRY
jgi:hypothetical protein